MPSARKATRSDKKRFGGLDMERNDARRSATTHGAYHRLNDAQ
jgi:hypothetical protein